MPCLNEKCIGVQLETLPNSVGPQTNTTMGNGHCSFKSSTHNTNFPHCNQALSAPLQRDKRQCSFDTPLVPQHFPKRNLKCKTPLRIEKFGATRPFSGRVPRFSCNTPPFLGKRSATECNATMFSRQHYCSGWVTRPNNSQPMQQPKYKFMFLMACLVW